MRKMLKLGLTASGIALLLADPKLRRALLGAVMLGAESAEKAFNGLVERGVKASRS